MSSEVLSVPSNGNKKMSEQINEIYDKIKIIEELVADLSPEMDKILDEINPVVCELRERFERDEIITLLKQVGDNTAILILTTEATGRNV